MLFTKEEDMKMSQELRRRYVLTDSDVEWCKEKSFDVACLRDVVIEVLRYCEWEGKTGET